MRARFTTLKEKFEALDEGKLRKQLRRSFGALFKAALTFFSAPSTEVGKNGLNALQVARLNIYL